MIEGQLRCAELNSYLEEMKTEKSVWLSEDGTALISKITYDPETEQMVGLLLPLNNNGCPIPFRLKIL